MTGKYVELKSKQDGNNNPVLICIDDIAVIQAEGILAGNTKIILKSGKALQIPESYCEVSEKILDVIKDKAETKTERKRYQYMCNISLFGDEKNTQVIYDRNLCCHYGVAAQTCESYVCIPLEYAGFNTWEPIEEKVKIIKKDEVEY